MELIYGMAAVCFLIGGICLFLALWSRDPRHLGTAVGKLADSKKVMRREYRYSEKKIPVTTSTYLYEVNGKTYRLKPCKLIKCIYGFLIINNVILNSADVMQKCVFGA